MGEGRDEKGGRGNQQSASREMVFVEQGYPHTETGNRVAESFVPGRSKRRGDKGAQFLQHKYEDNRP